MSTTGRPTRPVAPATAIFVLCCISVSLGGLRLHSRDTQRRGDVTDRELIVEIVPGSGGCRPSGEAHPGLGLTPRPDRRRLQRQPPLRGDEPRRVVLVLR